MSQKSQIINLRDQFDLNDYQDDQIDIELQSSKLSFPFIQLYKYSTKIQREYQNDHIKKIIKQHIKDIQHEYHINDENIFKFLKLLKDENVEINNDDYIDMKKLSNIFEIQPLTKFLNKYAREHSKDIDFIIQIIHSTTARAREAREIETETENDMKEYENILSEEINESLKNEKFQSLPISTIYRILEQSDRKKIDQKHLFHFIKDKLDERSVLFSFMNIENIEEETFNELYLKYEECKSNERTRFEYFPINLRYIKEMRETLKEKEKRIKNIIELNERLENKMKQVVKDNENLLKKMKEQENKINEITQTNERNEKLNEEQTLSNERLKKQITTIIEENDQLKRRIKEQEDESRKIEERLKQMKNENERIKQENKNIQYKIIKEIPFETELKGIFDYLNNHSNLKEELKLSSSKMTNGSLENIINFTNIGNINCFSGNPDPWICFEFKKHKIILSNYTIRSYICGRCHPKNWIIEGSNDFITWSQIDEQKDCQYMKGSTFSSNQHIHTFQIQQSNQKPFKYIKMTHKGHNWGGDSDLAFNCIEFYGQLLSNF